jgi:hypothetical protein
MKASEPMTSGRNSTMLIKQGGDGSTLYHRGTGNPDEAKPILLMGDGSRSDLGSQKFLLSPKGLVKDLSNTNSKVNLNIHNNEDHTEQNQETIKH